MAWVYIRNRDECSATGSLYTTGFYDPNGQWHPEGDYEKELEAAERVHWLNGGNSDNSRVAELERECERLRSEIERLIQELSATGYEV